MPTDSNLIKNSRSRQFIDGELKHVENNCVFAAFKTYNERHNFDKNPLIVQMILGDFRIIPHWYYRSDSWIEQNFFIPKTGITPYVGPLDRADSFYYCFFNPMDDWMKYLPDNIDKFLKFLSESGNDGLTL